MPFTNTKTGETKTLASDNCSAEWALKCIREDLERNTRRLQKAECQLVLGNIEEAMKLVRWEQYHEDTMRFVERLAYLANNPNAPVIHYETQTQKNVQ